MPFETAIAALGNVVRPNPAHGIERWSPTSNLRGVTTSSAVLSNEAEPGTYTRIGTFQPTFLAEMYIRIE